VDAGCNALSRNLSRILSQTRCRAFAVGVVCSFKNSGSAADDCRGHGQTMWGRIRSLKDQARRREFGGSVASLVEKLPGASMRFSPIYRRIPVISC
jgi:hypothetical protein